MPVPEIQPAPILEGIDVSGAQRGVDWERVKKDGISFAFLKASEGIDFEDGKYKDHAAGARAAGIPFGAYHFLRVRHERAQDAEEQAREFLVKYRREGCTAPAALDCERLPPTMTAATAIEHNASTQEERRTAIRDWLRVVTGELGAGLVYGSADYLTPIGLTDEDLFGAGLWAADYGVSTPILASPWGDWIGWQWTGSGRIAGYDGGVDLSHFRA